MSVCSFQNKWIADPVTKHVQLINKEAAFTGFTVLGLFKNAFCFLQVGWLKSSTEYTFGSFIGENPA